MTTDQLVTALTNRYGIRLSPKDPVFAVVYLNEIMLEQHAEALSARLEASLSNFLMQFRSQSAAAVREMKAAAADSDDAARSSHPTPATRSKSPPARRDMSSWWESRAEERRL